MPNNKKIAALVLGATLALAGTARAESTGQFIDDATITAKVKAALVADSKLKSTDITVNTDGGVVKLTGAVDTNNEYAMAGQDSNHITGVKAVANMLTIREEENN